MHGFAQSARAVEEATARPFAPEDGPAGVADITVSAVCKSFAGKPVLRDVTLHVPKAACVALIGANGAGKSTLLRACSGLTAIDAGRIAIAGQELGGLNAGQLRRLRAHIGFVFQRHNLSPRMSALSNVLHGALGRRSGPLLWTHRAAPRQLRAEAMECLNQVGLAHLAAQRCGTLSGGQSQRVAIARMLMQQPRLILADEPAASLDPASGREVMALLTSLTRKHGLTLLFSSHHLEHARIHADRIVALKAGAPVFEGLPAQLDAQQVKDIYG